jgi:hypothetical protein
MVSEMNSPPCNYLLSLRGRLRPQLKTLVHKGLRNGHIFHKIRNDSRLDYNDLGKVRGCGLVKAFIILKKVDIRKI